jgi:outer membrane protein
LQVVWRRGRMNLTPLLHATDCLLLIVELTAPKFHTMRPNSFHYPKPPMTTLRRLAQLTAVGAAAFAMPAQAQSLVDLYEAARGFDSASQSAKAQLDANQYKVDQARSAFLPKVSLAGGVNSTYLSIAPDQGPKSDRNFGAANAAVNASYPLYGPVNQVNVDLASKSITQAQTQLALVEQDLVVRVAQAYFDVLGSQDSLTFVRAQKAAVAEQLASAKRNFEVGTSTITDTREAQARFDLVIAQEIAAENDLLVKRLTLDQVVGKTGTQPKGVALPLALPPVAPADINAWVLRAQEDHPSVRLAQTGLDVAILETEKARSGDKPTLDLFGKLDGTRNEGSSASAVGAWVGTATVGVTFNMLLYAGNQVQNRIKETLALEEKSRSDLEGARRAVSQATRAAYYGVLSGQGQVNAFEAAEASSQSALDANKLGYQVGVRINIDVLNAQSQLFQTKRDLAKARYEVLVGSLKLRQANGSLKAEDLQGINALLVK